MEPRQEQQTPASAQPQRTEKKRRFRIVKLEERIAPGQGGQTNTPHPCGGGTLFLCSGYKGCCLCG